MSVSVNSNMSDVWCCQCLKMAADFQTCLTSIATNVWHCKRRSDMSDIWCSQCLRNGRWFSDMSDIWCRQRLKLQASIDMSAIWCCQCLKTGGWFSDMSDIQCRQHLNQQASIIHVRHLVPLISEFASDQICLIMYVAKVWKYDVWHLVLPTSEKRPLISDMSKIWCCQRLNRQAY